MYKLFFYKNNIFAFFYGYPVVKIVRVYFQMFRLFFAENRDIIYFLNHIGKSCS